MRPREDLTTIYQTALAAFAEYGYAKTTMADIAGRLHMTQGNLYLYVKNKKALYHKAVSHALLKWQSRVLEAVNREPEVKQKFLTMCVKAVAYLSKDKVFRRVLIRDPNIFPMFPVKDPFAQINANSVALIRSILIQGIEKGAFRKIDPDRAAEVIFAIYKMFIIRMYIQTDNRFIRKMFEDTLELVTQGLFMHQEP